MGAAADVRRTVDAVWRMESAKIVGALTRMVRDLGLAEELAQDALVSALEQWPQSGVPDKPGAWLMATAKHRAIDQMRRHAMSQRKQEQLAHEIEEGRTDGAAEIEAAVDDDVGDDLLRLMFIACHPALSTEARVALTLRILGGLTTDEIARAFLSTEATVAQRIVRAKRSLAERKVPFEVPRGPERAERLSSVLLFDQDRSRWDQLLIHRGLAALARAERASEWRGAYTIQAAIAACHARAPVPAATDWSRIAQLYAELATVAPSPVVELNRAVAIGMAFGPAAGLELADALTAEPSLERYHLLPAVRADFLQKLERFDEARAELERAASLTRNARERELLLARAAALPAG